MMSEILLPHTVMCECSRCKPPNPQLVRSEVTEGGHYRYVAERVCFYSGGWTIYGTVTKLWNGETDAFSFPVDFWNDLCVKQIIRETPGQPPP